MKTNTDYLMSLSPRDDSQIWFPQISDSAFIDVIKGNRKIVVAHEWSCPTIYEKTIVGFSQDNKLWRLKDLTDTSIIANTGGEFVFESGSMDYKGLIALSIPKDTNFFILEESKNDDIGTNRLIYFEPNVSAEFKEKVLSIYTNNDEGDSLTVIDDQKLTVSYEEYLTIRAMKNVFLV